MSKSKLTEPERATVDEKPIMLPMDEHNQKLVDNVHPHDWSNPTPKDRYHLVAIGAGSGGLISAAIGAGAGAKVALIERHFLGGDCLNVGCVPSKGVISAARAWHAAREAAEVFGGPEVSGEGNFGRVMERMRELRAGISPLDSARRFSDLGVDVFLGQGRFTGRDTIEVDGKTLNFRRAVVATGARAAAPSIPGLEDAGYLNNESIFSLTELPHRLTVIGAGPIGCEMAQSFARFGSKVTILDRADHVLPREDPDAAEIVQRQMERDGICYIPRVNILRVERRDNDRIVLYESDGKSESLAGDQILVAVGRAPNTEGLGLEEAGVRYDEHGVSVDDRLRTTNPSIFAVGDICSRHKFTHAADAHAKIAVANALFFGRGRVSNLVMPWCTYTSPEVAHVGHYESDARKAGHEVTTITVSLEHNDRAVLDGESDGFLRVHLKKGTDKILGATLVAAHAGDMIGEMAVAVTHGIGLKKIASTIHPYPTQGEIFKRAAGEYQKSRVTPRVKKILDIFFKIFK
jgi:pyruvate/2-oxoglutarate dehydrogenase complex dihydrolipoamide dehydrogenase (E3) component